VTTTNDVLMVDATNAFNSLNKKGALTHAMRICPSLSTVLVNTYRSAPSLFIDRETVWSKEGTTQGDPMAMAMYAIRTLPLFRHLKEGLDIKQIWYSDYSIAGGGLT
jgi:hypothetical protein